MSKITEVMEQGTLTSGVPIHLTLEEPMAVHFGRHKAGKWVKAYAVEYDFDRGFFVCTILNWDEFQSSTGLFEIRELQQAMSLPAVKEYIQRYAKDTPANEPELLGSISVHYSDRELTLDVMGHKSFIGLQRNNKLLLVISLPKLRVCTAEDCDNIYVPTPRGRKQLYCSKACKMREYRKRRKVRSGNCT